MSKVMTNKVVRYFLVVVFSTVLAVSGAFSFSASAYSVYQKITVNNSHSYFYSDVHNTGSDNRITINIRTEVEFGSPEVEIELQKKVWYGWEKVKEPKKVTIPCESYAVMRDVVASQNTDYRLQFHCKGKDSGYSSAILHTVFGTWQAVS